LLELAKFVGKNVAENEKLFGAKICLLTNSFDSENC
jgi:hypothetical protein